MKSFMIAITMMIMTPVVAFGDTSCKKLSGLGEYMMSQRQKEQPLAEMIKQIQAIAPSAEAHTFLTMMAYSVYEEPIWTDNFMKERAIQEYQSRIEFRCRVSK